MQTEQTIRAALDEREVLVVDDDKNYRRIALLRLTSAGCRCYEASNIDEAMSVLQSAPAIGVVLLDYSLHGNSKGPGDVVSRIRRRHPDLQIIGHSAAERANEFRTLGVNAFLRKPLAVADLWWLTKGGTNV